MCLINTTIWPSWSLLAKKKTRNIRVFNSPRYPLLEQRRTTCAAQTLRPGHCGLFFGLEEPSSLSIRASSYIKIPPDNPLSKIWRRPIRNKFQLWSCQPKLPTRWDLIHSGRLQVPQNLLIYPDQYQSESVTGISQTHQHQQHQHSQQVRSIPPNNYLR